MRSVLMVSVEDPEHSWGGIGTFLKLLLSLDSDSGYRFDLLTTSYKEQESLFNGNKIFRLKTGDEGPSHPVYSLNGDEGALKEICDALYSRYNSIFARYDYILFHNEELFPLFETVKAYNPGLPLLYFCHGPQSYEHPDNPGLQTLQRKMISSSEVTFVLSSWMQTALTREGASNIRRVVPPLAIMRSWYEPGSANDRESILCAGRATCLKGIDLFLKALGECRSVEPLKHTKIHCGHGNHDYLQYCREIPNRFGIKIPLLSWVSHVELLRQLRKSRLLVMPSRFEPFGLLAAESIFCGAPVIASDVGGLSELLSKTGILISDLDSRQGISNLARAIDNLYGNPEQCTKLAERSSQILTSFYSIPNFRMTFI